MKNKESGSINIISLLGLTFVILKLTHVIDWDWIWVTMPFWLGLSIWAVIIIVLFIIFIAKEMGERL